MGVLVEPISFFLQVCHVLGLGSKVISKVKIFKLAGDGPLDTSMFVSSCSLHCPVDDSQGKNR